MTKDELWKKYCDKNPTFADENAEIYMTGRGLKKLFDQTFEMGEKQGRDSAPPTRGKGIFGDIFG